MPGKKFALARLSSWGARHGGLLRTLQVRELVQEALPDVVLVDTERYSPATLRQKIGFYVHAAAHLGTLVRFRLGLRDAGYAGVGFQICTEHGLRPGDSLIFDADARKGEALTAVAHARQLSLIALPHNFEAFVPQANEASPGNARIGERLRRELRWLERAEQVWAISSFDQELFQLFGIPAGLLPYQPPRDRIASLMDIRRRRAAESTGDYALVLGTASNYPTYKGMVQLLRFVRRQAIGLRIVVAGFGTEKLAGECSPEVAILGALDDVSLAGHLAQARVIWVHQSPTTGALTRISEAAFAGIPVVANRWAMRGALPNAGLLAYEDLEEAPALLKGNLPVPAVPDLSSYHERFIRELRSVAAPKIGVA